MSLRDKEPYVEKLIRFKHRSFSLARHVPGQKGTITGLATVTKGRNIRSDGIYSPRRHVPLARPGLWLCDKRIKRVHVTKYLRLYIDDRISWRPAVPVSSTIKHSSLGVWAVMGKRAVTYAKTLQRLNTFTSSIRVAPCQGGSSSMESPRVVSPGCFTPLLRDTIFWWERCNPC